MLAIIITAQPVIHITTVGIDHVFICSFVSVIPSILFTTQKKLSLKCPIAIAPIHVDIVASTGLTPNEPRIGAEIDADVIIATVLLP